MNRTLLIVATAVALVALTANVLLPAAVRQDLGWMDSVSGSRKSQTIWRFGSASTPVVSDSPIALRYRKLGLQWQQDWKNVKGTYVNAFGRNVGSAHGWPAPAIYDLAVSPEIQQLYLAAASDDEVRDFFRVISSGTETEKKAAVEAAGNKALAHDSVARPGE